MNPVSLAQSIPVKYRKAIYSILATVASIETALDLFDYGLVAEKPQAAVLAVLAALGFGIATANTQVSA